MSKEYPVAIPLEKRPEKNAERGLETSAEIPPPPYRTLPYLTVS